jgi:tetratricopeptide (TPR) repeat protein
MSPYLRSDLSRILSTKLIQLAKNLAPLKHPKFQPIQMVKIWLLTCLLISGGSLFGQNQDSIQLIRSSGGGRALNGKITGVSPLNIQIQTSQETRDIHPSQINRISFLNQPLEIDRARNQMNSGRFDDALEELQKISDTIGREEIKQEIAFLKARAAAEISLRGGGVSSQEAGRAVADFLRNFPNSYHFYPATELQGQLLLAIGRFELAETEFAKLQDSQWQEYIIRGWFQQSESLIQQNKPEQAAAVLRQILEDPNTDDLTQNYKLLAKTRLALTEGMQGRGAEAIQSLEQIIKVENADNSILFAYAYNSLGSIYLQQGKTKEAMMAFLHTELLYPNESEAHAEALYQLALIWPKLDQNERANRARNTLKSRYRNSLWANRL